MHQVAATEFLCVDCGTAYSIGLDARAAAVPLCDRCLGTRISRELMRRVTARGLARGDGTADVELPLVRGGQGRSDDESVSAAGVAIVCLAILGLGALLAGALSLFGLL